MSTLPLRLSSQATIAPPAPSETIVALAWAPGAVQSATPSAIHCGAPAAFNRWA
jgi:hypothetical protein